MLTAAAENIFANFFTAALYLDLPLVLALQVGWYSSPTRGAISGTAFGLLQDAASGIYLGLNGVSKAVLGFSGSYLSKWLVLEGFLARCLLIAGLTALDKGIVTGMTALLGQPIQQDIWSRTLIEMPVTGVAGGIIFQLYERLKFPRKDFRRL